MGTKQDDKILQDEQEMGEVFHRGPACGRWMTGEILLGKRVCQTRLSPPSSRKSPFASPGGKLPNRGFGLMKSDFHPIFIQ
jgi:hypothetical protein